MSSVHVLYFASFRERLQRDKETIELSDNIKTVSDLKQFLAQRQGVWQELFNSDNSTLIAINQSMAKNHSNLSDKDEIAFFPPVTGG